MNKVRPLKLPVNPRRVREQNKALWNEARSPDRADFFTLGYEGRTLAEIVELLKRADVRSLLDIRHSPVSMYRPEVSKSNLQRTIERAGMHYVHLREWGVPRMVRAHAVEEGTREAIWDWYDASVVDRYFDRNLHWFLNLDHPVAMMCVEADPTECHRHLLFMALERQGLRGFDL
jgi:uncharacterized protein (DUF488 family)